MVRLYFYVEGQTEQGYVTRVLTPHLVRFGVQVMGAVRAASGRKHGHVSRGGGKRYQPMRNDLGNLLRQHKSTDTRFTWPRGHTGFLQHGVILGCPDRRAR
jgi:hypothetical protein